MGQFLPILGSRPGGSYPPPTPQDAALCHGLNLFDLGDVLLEDPLDPDLEGDRAGGAADARTVEVNPHQALVAHLDQLHVPVVGLHGGPDQVEDPLDVLTQRLRRGPGGRSPGFSPARAQAALRSRHRDDRRASKGFYLLISTRDPLAAAHAIPH